jgi:hypothetical protein
MCIRKRDLKIMNTIRINEKNKVQEINKYCLNCGCFNEIWDCFYIYYGKHGLMLNNKRLIK